MSVRFTLFRKKKTAEVTNATEAPRTIYDYAKEVGERIDEVAHPTDLLKDEGFLEVCSKLAASSYTNEELCTYMQIDKITIATLAAAALGRRPCEESIVEAILEAINGLAGTVVRFFALQSLDQQLPAPKPLLGRLFVALSDDWSDGYDRAATQMVRELVRKRLAAGERAELGDALEKAKPFRLDDVAALIRKLDVEAQEPLRKELETFRERTTNVDFLRAVGAVWEDDEIAKQIVDYEPQHEAASLVVSTLESRNRSVLLIGNEGVGKSTILRLAAKRLRQSGWTIFEAGAAELMAGQKYFGELEARMRKLLVAIEARKKVIWVVPRFQELMLAGQHRYSESGLLDSILPLIESGSIVVLGELTSDAYQKLVEQRRRVSSVMSAIRVEPADAAATQELAAQWAKQRSTTAEPLADETTLREAWQMSTQFLSMRAAPGNLLELLEQTRARLAASGHHGSISIDDILSTLSLLSGLPLSILDEREGLDLAGVRGHFEARVMGQTEAVDVLVERVAMIKAALTDATRPLGVFLFAGPTGTGKTEIAKALAEYLFGSADRMIRVDMSELKMPDSLSRLVGDDSREATSLIDAIRKQPFSVVLLDEFEKAHPSVWDLFLQLFDDGRLTDRRGVTADFRHALIIMTSNVGASIQLFGRAGFSDSGNGFIQTNVMTALEREFRKEFINRIDRVVVFRPLSRDIMRSILKKELNEAFARRGLRNRAWAVEWDDQAVDFLLHQGFTPDLGARPLKRAVERWLLAPLAERIVRRETPEGEQFLFVKSDGSGLTFDFVDPDARPVSFEEKNGAGIEEIVLSASGSSEELEELRLQRDELQRTVRAAEWSARKEGALSMTSLPEFWSSEERFAILDEAERRDRIEGALESVASLLGRFDGRNVAPADVTRRVAQQLWLIRLAVEDLQERKPSDAFLQVEWRREAAVAGEEIVSMYREWAARRGMRLEVLKTSSECFVAAVSGFGAWTLLQGENGIHSFESAESSPHRRLQCRVRVAAQPMIALSGRDRVLIAAEKLLAADGEPVVVRRYRRDPSPLVRDSVKGWRSGRLDEVLNGDFDLMGMRRVDPRRVDL